MSNEICYYNHVCIFMCTHIVHVHDLDEIEAPVVEPRLMVLVGAPGAGVALVASVFLAEIVHASVGMEVVNVLKGPEKYTVLYFRRITVSKIFKIFVKFN